MRIIKGYKKCKICGTVFKLDLRAFHRHKLCGKESCIRKHRAQYQKRYRRKNPIEEAEYRKKRKENLPIGFWKIWRNAHPDYVIKNRISTRLRKQLKEKGLQRKLDILEVNETKGKFRQFKKFAAVSGVTYNFDIIEFATLND